MKDYKPVPGDTNQNPQHDSSETTDNFKHGVAAFSDAMPGTDSAATQVAASHQPMQNQASFVQGTAQHDQDPQAHSPIPHADQQVPVYYQQMPAPQQVLQGTHYQPLPPELQQHAPNQELTPPPMQAQVPLQQAPFPPQVTQAHPVQGPAVEKKKPKKNLIFASLALSFALIVGGFGLFFALNGDIFTGGTEPGIVQGDDQLRGSSSSTTIELPTELTNPSEDELSVQVAQMVLPSVVSISGNMRGMGFGAGGSQSAGAGVILSSEGYIVTNNHVIENLDNITVTAGAQIYPAVLVGADPSTDLAVLKIDSDHDLPAIELGTSSNLLEGQYVMAVGSPFGHEQSVSAGIISGLGRNNIIATQSTLTAYVDLIQTDAAINPGNSGGALVDKAGRLIGINSLINTLSGASAGVGFAIPVDTVINVSNQLIESGHASHAFLGVGTQSITPEIARAYGLPVERGAVVNTVAGGSPADRAGIQVGDFIVRIGDRDISSSEDVFSAIRANRVGDRIEVEIYRSGSNDVLEATLASDDFMNRSQEQQSPNLPPDHPPASP